MEDIFTYVNPDKILCYFENIIYGAFFKISFLIKDRVIRQKLFIIYGFNLMIIDYCCRIVYVIFFSVYKSYNSDNI